MCRMELVQDLKAKIGGGGLMLDCFTLLHSLIKTAT